MLPRLTEGSILLDLGRIAAKKATNEFKDASQFVALIELLRHCSLKEQSMSALMPANLLSAVFGSLIQKDFVKLWKKPKSAAAV